MDAPELDCLTRQGAADARAGKISIGNSFSKVSEQLAYQGGYENPHAEFKRWLGGHLNAQSEATKIEYRHREDRALAVMSVVGPVWDGIKNKTSQLQGLQESRWRKIEGVAFILGAVIGGLRLGSYSVDIGRGLMLIGAISFGYYAFNLREARWHIVHLERQQELFLLEWLASGASEYHFHKFKLLHFRSVEHSEKISDSDEWRAKNIQLEHSQTRLRLDVRRALLERIGVNLPFEDFDEE